MRETIKKFWYSNRETKYFALMYIIYAAALVWTTLQAYARLDYSRSDRAEPIVIQQSSQNE